MLPANKPSTKPSRLNITDHISVSSGFQLFDGAQPSETDPTARNTPKIAPETTQATNARATFIAASLACESAQLDPTLTDLSIEVRQENIALRRKNE
jgi:hypothetical protein